nr:hypothetical protein [uncultured Butyrivibrio sp.]
MFIRKGQWMGICAAAVVMSLVFDPVLTSATGAEEITIFGSGYSVPDNADENLIGDALEGNTGIGEIISEIQIDEDEIWAQIDRDELRSFVDAEELGKLIDKEAILDSIDINAIRSQVDEERIAIEVDNDVHPADVINVQLPIIGNESPFDFLIDPQNLIYLTDAARYGGGKVEEGASILFKNTQGDYAFSSKSDELVITNRSNIPVRLSIRAEVSNLGGTEFVGSRSELTGDTPSLFMALADKDGIRSVITEYGEATIDVVLEAAPDGTYDFKWNEDLEKYEYKVANEEADFDSFSFYIIADCNKDGDWGSVYGNPVISVSWMTEPVIPEPEEISDEEQEILGEIDELVRKYLGMRDVVSSDTSSYEQNKDDEAEDETSGENAEGATISEDTNKSSVEAVDNLDNIYRETIQVDIDQEEIRNAKINNLINKELIKLVTAEYQRIYQEELDKLIEAEVDKMAQDLFEELKEKEIARIHEEKKSDEAEGEAAAEFISGEDQIETEPEEIDATVVDEDTSGEDKDTESEGEVNKDVIINENTEDSKSNDFSGEADENTGGTSDASDESGTASDDNAADQSQPQEQDQDQDGIIIF